MRASGLSHGLTHGMTNLPPQDLTDAVEAEDAEAFTNVVAEYDALSRLDPWKTTMLVSGLWGVLWCGMPKSFHQWPQEKAGVDRWRRRVHSGALEGAMLGCAGQGAR